MSSRKAVVVTLGVFILLFQSVLSAHAILMHATPEPDSTVSGPSLDIALKFNSRIDSKRSSLSLLLPSGKVETITIGEQSSPDMLSAKVNDLSAGKYRVRWQVLAIDGHITRGDYAFNVK